MAGGTLLKITAEGGRAFHGGRGRWSLPHDGEPGEWMPAIKGTLVACERGYHLFEPKDIVKWIGPALWIAEADGETLDNGDKIVCRRARLVSRVEAWNSKALSTWALDCAERAREDAEKALGNFETMFASDERRRAIEAAWAESAAAWAAAAARSARSARSAAAWAARSARSAESAAAWAAALDWQTRHLLDLIGLVPA